MTDDLSTTNEKKETMEWLKDLVLEHLGIPRPKQGANVQTLQDDLLPTFLDLARHASLASSRVPSRTGLFPNAPTHPIYDYLHGATEVYCTEVRTLNEILEEMGVHALLEEVAESPEVAMISELPVDDYDTRLLREAGHRDPNRAVHEFLRYIAKHPGVLGDSNAQLEKAQEAMLRAHRDINVTVNINTTGAPPPAPAIVAATPAAKPKRAKLFLSLGKLAQGLVLLSGNAIAIPTVALGSITALPILGSLAAGIGAVGDGVSNLLREGE